MTSSVHVRPVREKRGALGYPVVSGSELERRERQLDQVRASRMALAEVPEGESGHLFWPRVCPLCNPNLGQG